MGRGTPKRGSRAVPYGTPAVLPVDSSYRIRPAARAAYQSRMRLHGFDLVAPEPRDVAAGAFDSEPTAIPGVVAHRVTWPRPIQMRAGDAWVLPELPRNVGGLVAARVQLASGGAVRVCVAGEAVGGGRRAAWGWRLPLQGEPYLVAGRATGRVRAAELWSYWPAPLEDLDRYPLHRPLRVGRELHVPLVPWRRGRAIEQVAIHWGSVEYRYPDRSQPLCAWGYPWYLDGVVGDVWLARGGRRWQIAAGKFLEFDEVENIRCASARAADRVVIRLRSREGLVPPPECRIAAVEVRYAPAPLRRGERRDVGAWARPDRPLALRLPAGRALVRVDLSWSDHGPAMGAVSAGNARSRFVNVCSGERRTFAYLFGRSVDALAVHARGAPLYLESLRAYYGERQ